MLKDHQKDSAGFENAAEKAQNPDVKAFATKTLPVINAHLEKIEAIAAEEKK